MTAEARVVITAEDQATPTFRAINAEAVKLGAIIGSSAVGMQKLVDFASQISIGGLKQAINDADKLNDMSQKLGMGVQQLAAYKLAAEQSGSSLEVIAQGVKSLSSQMLKHSDAFKKIGIDTKDPDKALRQLADVFANMPDGMDKAALATKMFGRAGLELIPTLNMGSKGLDDAAKKAEKYAQTMALLAPEADKLNDTMAEFSLVGRALYANVAADVVPGLTNIASAMAEAAREGGILTSVMVGLGGVLHESMGENYREGLRISGDSVMDAMDLFGGVNPFRTVDEQVAHFRGEVTTLKIKLDELTASPLTLKMNLDSVTQDLDKAQKRLEYFKAWQAREMLADTNRRIGDYRDARDRSGEAAPVIARLNAEKEASARTQALLDAYRKGVRDLKPEVDEYEKLMTRLNAKDSGVDPDYVKNVELLIGAWGKGKLTLEELGTTLNTYAGQQKFMIEYEKAATEAEKARQKVREHSIHTAQKEAESLADQVARAREENEQIGLTVEQLDALKLARIDTAIATKKQALATLEAGSASAAEVQAILRQIDALSELRGITASSQIKTANKKAIDDQAKAWEKFADDVERSLTDALMRSFEAGDSFGKAFAKSLENTFKTMVLKVAVQAIIDPVMGQMRSVFGLSNAAGAASGAGSLLNGLTMANLTKAATSLYSLANGSLLQKGFSEVAMSKFGAELGLSKTMPTILDQSGNPLNSYGMTDLGNSIGASLAKAGAAIMGNAIGNAISGDYRVFQGASLASIGAVIGSIVPGLGGLVGGVVGGVLDRAFGMDKINVGDQGVQGTFSGMGFNGYSYQDWNQKGGWFRSGRSGTNTANLPGEAIGQMSLAFAAIKIQVGGLAESVGAATTSIANYSRSIRQSIAGAAWDALLASMADDMAKLALAGTSYGKEGEKSIDTLNRLASSLQTTNSWLGMLKQRVLQVSLAGANAASQLVDLMGGLDKFKETESRYFQTYYDREEQLQALQAGMRNQLALLGLAIPDSMSSFRNLAASIDLNSDAGRRAYASLMDLAPTFAELSQAVEAMARETAAQLLATFTARGELGPALDSMALSTLAIANASQQANTSSGAISAMFLDLSGGLIEFSTTTDQAQASLTGAQQAGELLASSIDKMRQSAAGGIIDFNGLAEALRGSSTTVFVATLNGIFDNLAKRLQGVLGSIAEARIGVREDALKIINPGAMSYDQIAHGISEVQTKLPSMDALLAASKALTDKNAAIASVEKSYALALTKALETGAAVRATASANGLTIADAAFAQKENGTLTYWDNILHGYGDISGKVSKFNESSAAQGGLVDRAFWDVWLVSALKQNIDRAKGELPDLESAVKTATVDYSKALQDFALNADLSVKKLNRLRTETVRYYEEQARLANLMQASATTLRGTIEGYRFSQLSDAGKFDKLQTDYATAYAMGLSTSGEVLAGYGDKLNSLLTPMLEAAQGVLDSAAYSTFAATAIARAETIAGRLETLAPAGYEASSLDLLGSIDTALMALDESTLSANAAVIKAIDAGKDLTAQGLRAVVAALTGKTVPAFAAGGLHAGGLRLVGERGPELEVTGPSRIINAADTARMLRRPASADIGALLAELQAMRNELANLRAEARATAVATNKSARYAERWDVDGMTVRTEADAPLLTEVVA